MSGVSATRPEAVEASAAALAVSLRGHVGELFAGGGECRPEVRIVRTHVRARSNLYTFRVLLPSGDRSVVVKTAPTAAGPADQGSGGARADRPRITPFAEPRLAVDLEYQALSRIEDHFLRVNDPRFGAVRVFDRVREHDGFVMEALDQPNLRGVALDRRSSRAVLQRSFCHSGAWLRAYHTLATRGGEPALQARRGDFIRFTGDLAAYLAAHTGRGAFFAWLTSTTAELARVHLPDRLPLALGHGDYAMRNILIGPDERVTVLDTLARYRTCTYRDVGYFLGDLRCSALPALVRGRWQHARRLAAHREAFLTGYFGDSIVPADAVGLFEAQAMLEQWASVVSESRLAAGRLRRVRRAGLPLASAFFRRAIRVAMRSLGR